MCHLILSGAFLLGTIDDPPSELLILLTFVFKAPGRAHGRPFSSLWYYPSYFPGFCEPEMRCGLGEFGHG